jgi:imidazolonepropionase-like amidohydrolase
MTSGLRVLSSVSVVAALLVHAVPPQPLSLAFTHVTLIDATGGPARPDTTVVVSGDRISTIGPTLRVRIPAAADVIDANGKVLIPGLWDMHVHLGSYDDGRQTLRRLLASGVTGVRDMASPLVDVLHLRSDTRTGTIPGPEIVAAGPMLQARLPFPLPPLVRMVGPGDATSTVDDLKSADVNFIKVGDTISREVYFRIAREAGRVGLPVAGHLTPFVSVREAVDAGQRSVEHFGSAGFRNLLVATSTDESSLSAYAQAALDAAVNGGEAPDVKLYRAEFTARLADTYNAHKARALFTTMAKRGTRLTPTFVAIRELWEARGRELSADDAIANKRAVEQTTRMFLDARRAGVKILAGTDLPLRDGVSAIHTELEALVSAGLTPMEALQTATRDPADFLGRLRTSGTIEPGKVADLVLLDADPLVDIRNSRRISAVVVRGRMRRAPELREASGGRHN